MKALKLLFSNLDHFRRQFWTISMVGFTDGVVMFFFPLIIAEFAKLPLSWDSYLTASALLIVTWCTSLGLQWNLRRYGEALGPKISHHLRLKYFNSITRIPIEKLQQHHSGYLLSLVNRVADGIGGIAVEIFWGVSKSLSNMLLFFAFTARESVTVAIVNFILLTVFIAISTYLSRKMVPLAADLNLRNAGFYERFADMFMNIATIKRLNIAKFAESGIQNRLQPTLEQVEKLQTFHAHRWCFLHFLFGVSFISTVLFMLKAALDGTTSPAILILFVGVYSIVRNHIERLSEDFKWLLEMGAYIKSLEEITNFSETTETTIVREWRQLRLNNITFSYSSNERLIQIPEFEIQAGEIVAIVGPSGEGKTTLLNIVAGHLKPQHGSIAVDGQILGRTTVLETSLISQEVELFNLSLRDNLSLDSAVTDDLLLTHLEQLNLKPWFDTLPDGFATQLGERGVTLSAGQKQRINLIRGVLLQRSLILLDEPTAHLDHATERLVINYLRTQLKTAIIATHSTAILSICGRKYDMRRNTLKPAS